MLGTLLIQPQALARMAGRSPGEDLADEVVALAQRLLADPAQAETLAPVFSAALEALAGRFLARWQPNLPAISADLLGLLAPVTAPLQQLGAGGAADSVPALLRRLADLLDGLDDLPAALSDDGLRSLIQRVTTVLGSRLGLSQDLLHTEIRATLGDIRTRLHALAPTLDTTAGATCTALACLLARLETQALALPRLDLDPGRLAIQLIGALRIGGFEEIRSRIACFSAKLQALLRSAADLADAAAAAVPKSRALAAPVPRAARRRAAPRDGAAPRAGSAAPPRSEDDRYCWYASWLFAERRQRWYEDIVPGYPEDEVWQTKDKKCLVLRRANHADEVLHRAEAPFEWYQAPPFASALGQERFSFGTFSAQFLEVWTRVGVTAVEGGKGLWHLIDMATGERKHGANLPLWLWNWAKAVSAGAQGTPLPSLIFKAGEAGLGAKFLLTPFPAWVAVLFGSIQGHHSATNFKNQFLYWATLAGSNALTAYVADALLYACHDLTLSFFTLINQGGGEGGPEPVNWQHGKPWIELVTFFALLIMVKAKSRDDYSYPFSWGDNGMQALWFFLIAPAIGALGSALGTLLVWALARHADGGQIARELGYGALRGLRDFYLWEYIFKEGDTDDGKYNPTIDPDGKAYSPARQPAPGYPPADSSPYRLPYEKDRTLFVGQANLGTFSHMRFSFLPQVYAYDFAHDFGDEILCARDGTVVDYFDWIVDDTDPSFSQMMDAIKEAIAWTGAADPSLQELKDAIALPASNLVDKQSGRAQIKVEDVKDGSGNQVFEVDGAGNPRLDGSGNPIKRQRIIDTFFNWNFILVRHDTLDTTHDKDAGGANVTTFAVYGHGKKGSVRAAFNARSVAPKAIIGQAVTRGQVIMHAGDTGTSFHNHLHMHVVGATSPGQATAVPPIDDGDLTQYTLPFVFKEATHVLHRDGVLRRLTWYTSDNPKLP